MFKRILYQNHEMLPYFFYIFVCKLYLTCPYIFLREGLEFIVLSPVVKLVLETDDLLQLPDLSVSFVTHQRAVEVHREQYENNSKWHHYTGGGNGRCLSRADGAIFTIIDASEW